LRRKSVNTEHITVSDGIESETIDRINIKGISSLTLLPVNYYDSKSETDPIFSSTTVTVKKLLASNNINVSIALGPNDGTTMRELDQRGAEWFGPVLLVSSLLLSNDPNALNVALSIIANYLTQLFAGSPGKAHLKVIVVDEEKSIRKTLEYKGPSEGLINLDKVAKSVLQIESHKDEVKHIEETKKTQA
jgi:hypothetical protein